MPKGSPECAARSRTQSFSPSCLSKGLVEGDGDRVGEIVAAFVDAWHRDGYEAVLVDFVEWRRETMAFVAENQIVALLELAVVYAPVGFVLQKNILCGLLICRNSCQSS